MLLQSDLRHDEISHPHVIQNIRRKRLIAPGGLRYDSDRQGQANNKHQGLQCLQDSCPLVKLRPPVWHDPCWTHIWLFVPAISPAADAVQAYAKRSPLPRVILDI